MTAESNAFPPSARMFNPAEEANVWAEATMPLTPMVNVWFKGGYGFDLDTETRWHALAFFALMLSSACRISEGEKARTQAWVVLAIGLLKVRVQQGY